MPGGGDIGMTLCPGKRGDSIGGHYWQRDLATDLGAILRWGAKVLVTAMEADELEVLGVANLGKSAMEMGLSWLHVPITDGDIPDQRFYESWPVTAPKLLQYLVSRNRIVIHCRGGLGRTGMVACFLLIEAGFTPPEAIISVRRARPGTVETSAQEAFVLGYERGVWSGSI